MQRPPLLLASILLPAALFAAPARTASDGPAGSAEFQATPAQERAITAFVTHLFNEDAAELDATTAGELQSDLRKYFWIRKAVGRDAEARAARWEGSVEVLGGRRVPVLDTRGAISEHEEDVFQVRVGARTFAVILDGNRQVLGIDDAPTGK